MDRLFSKSQIGRLFTAAQAFAQSQLDNAAAVTLATLKPLDPEAVLLQVCKEVNIAS